MEDKKLSPQQSIELIAAMIESTKSRVAMPDLRVSVMWATLTVLTAAVVMAGMLVAHDPAFNWLWFSIPVIGIPLQLFMTRKSAMEKRVRTYIDRVSDIVWGTVGFIGVAVSLICLAFNICGYPQAWLAMFFYAFIVVGFGAAVSGALLQERSYIIGGVFSVLAGFVVVILSLCRIPLQILWVLPLYMACFLMMFIMPAFIIRGKLRRAENR